MKDIEKIALTYLSKNLQTVVKSAITDLSTNINEIRIRLNKPLSLTAGRNNILINYICTSEDINLTLSNLCQGSLYSYIEYIKEGLIPTEHGIRAGVCGRAVVRNSKIECVRDITSINIRIPHRIYGAADTLYELVKSQGSVLIFSKPGLGKTTLLRELLDRLSNERDMKPVAVIDTRYELAVGDIKSDSADILLGYPRYDGIVTAIRTMSPEYILCDEISSKDDAESIMSAYSAGVKIVASAHAGTYKELLSNDNIARLISNNVFSAGYWISDRGYEVINFD